MICSYGNIKQDIILRYHFHFSELWSYDKLILSVESYIPYPGLFFFPEYLFQVNCQVSTVNCTYAASIRILLLVTIFVNYSNSRHHSDPLKSL